jgi:hypothetical protein
MSKAPQLLSSSDIGYPGFQLRNPAIVMGSPATKSHIMLISLKQIRHCRRRCAFSFVALIKTGILYSPVGICRGNLNGKDHLRDIGVDGMILKTILKSGG